MSSRQVGCALLLALSACKVGRDYERPPIRVPESYASLEPGSGGETSLREDWWTLFADAELSKLEGEAVLGNQDVQAAAARVAEARAASRAVASAFYPVVSLDPSLTRARTITPQGPITATMVLIPFDVGYEIDVWGRVRRAHESSEARAQASADDYAVVLRTLTADLAQSYFTLRSLDAQAEVVSRSLDLFRKQIELTKTKVSAGLVGETDVLQAETLLDTATAQLSEIRRQRADAEHALAILTGRPPSELSVEPSPLSGEPPVVPAGLPADLLRRRADVAEAEQNLIAANADVGVAKADFYPAISLSGSAGFESNDLQHALDSGNRVWSFGPRVSLPIFEGGRLSAQLEQAKARYDELVASFRQVLLAAFRDVEDSLADLHHRKDAADAQARAVESSRRYLELSQIQYDHGIQGYLQVLDAQRTLLSNELADAQLRNQRFVSTVLLVKALGGGWDPETSAVSPQRREETR